MLRIIAGEYRSRRLHGPPDEAVSRPYANRAKEAVFNLLRGWFEDASVLDLFAGVGTVGLEAVSRGARSVTMVERDRQMFRLLERNVAELGCGDRVTLVQGDALGPTALLRALTPIDLIFVDPPYALMTDDGGRARVLGQIGDARSVMAERGFVVLRSPIGPDTVDLAVPGFDGPEAHNYGKNMWVLLYAPAAGAPEAPEAPP